MAILGKTWGTGICIPWTPWPPTQSPTVPATQSPADTPVISTMPIMNPELSEQQRAEVEQLIQQYPDIWANGNATGRTNLVTHRIDTSAAAPIYQRPHRLSPHEAQILREEVQSMKRAGTIVESKSSWASPPVMVPKKDGSVRVCIDYRALNNVTVKDVYPLPRMYEIIQSLGNAQHFTKIDLKSGYWQIALEPSDRHKTAFITRHDLYELLVMPFGLTSAPATFQRLVNTIFADMLWVTVMVYLDDIVVYTDAWQAHLAALDEVFLRLRNAGLKASPSKCEIAQEQLLYLGHLITREGVLPDPALIQTIQEAQVPQCITDMRHFIGITHYTRIM